MVIIQTSPPGVKKYIDSKVSAEATARANADSGKVSKTGDTMTGNLTLNNARVYVIGADSQNFMDFRNNSFALAGDVASTLRNSIYWVDKNSTWYNAIDSYRTSADSRIQLNCKNKSGAGMSNPLRVLKTDVGDEYATCPTPSSASDNSTKIATTSWVNTADSLVHKTGNETIAGTKTFSSPIIDPRNKAIVFTTPNTSSDASAKPYYKVLSFANVGTWNGSMIVLKVSNPYVLGGRAKEPSTIRLGLKLVNLTDTPGAVSSCTLTILPGGVPGRYLTADCFKAFYNTSTKIFELWVCQSTMQVTYLMSIDEIGNRLSTYFNSLSMTTPTGVASLPATSSGYTQVDCTSAPFIDIRGDGGAPIIMKDTRYANGTNPSTNLYQSIFFTDKNDLQICALEHLRTTAGNLFQINAKDVAGNWMTQPFVLVKTDTSECVQVPTPSNKAENSNVVATTSWVNTASSVVHKTGNETVAGTKTFTASPNSVSNNYEGYVVSNPIRDPSDDSYYGNSLIFRDKDNWDVSYFFSEKQKIQGKFANTTRMTSRYRDNSGTYTNSVQVVTTFDGTGYATAPATPTSATSNEIATAGWVNTKLSAIKDYNDKVEQLNLTDAMGIGTNMPLLMKIVADDASPDDDVTASVGFVPSVMVNPSEGSISANTFIGTLEGTAAVAFRARCDSNGQVLTSTYLKKNDLGSSLPAASSSTLGCVRVGDGLRISDTVLETAPLFRIGTFLREDEYSFKNNTWYLADDFIPEGCRYAIITVTTWQSQNLQVRVGYDLPSGQLIPWQYIVDCWDNYNSGGRSSGTFIVGSGMMFYIEVNVSSSIKGDISEGYSRYSALFL